MAGFGNTWGPGGRLDQPNWEDEMQSGTQQDYNADEGIRSDPMSESSQRYSSGHGQEYDQQHTAMQGDGRAQGEDWGGRYQGGTAQAYPQTESTQGGYGQRGMGGQGMHSFSRIGEDEPSDERFMGEHGSQGFGEQEQQAEKQSKPSGILGCISSLGDRVQRAAECRFGGGS
ncbi:hypothetical protein D8B26_003706 [Coccidioides posadasii str. Silveira]|uniref:Uncharacterized protein n=1 Tax=Coccidioides posadasii (strain RMSCC 757 / Silveira) TaxID=443226 RepID=E9DII3_COCPS|nr:conserved hypothetical protein [Coccidioides posadasii str. Silveira]QVM09038.1 hypothetical protein D8B26_003706 [Coccidioides posadasii str. Silveira]